MISNTLSGFELTVMVVFQSYGLVLMGRVPPIYWTLFQALRSAAEQSAAIEASTRRYRRALGMSNRLQYKSARRAGQWNPAERRKLILSGWNRF